MIYLNVVDTKTNTDIQLRVKTTLKFILPFRKIKVPKALSWDLTGYPRQNIVRIRTEDRRFRLLDDEQGRKMIRIALHPRDQHRALEDQLAMIRELEDQGRTILLYRDLIQKLQHTPVYEFLIVFASYCFEVSKRLYDAMYIQISVEYMKYE